MTTAIRDRPVLWFLLITFGISIPFDLAVVLAVNSRHILSDMP